ncbi:MAG: hypothetical protein C0606_10930 [Hyphomicrobiales bacterium]|nr:MAG: hypothetical protein C0606_10930 [Hyphomicrobiales bacterium]
MLRLLIGGVFLIAATTLGVAQTTDAAPAAGGGAATQAAPDAAPAEQPAADEDTAGSVGDDVWAAVDAFAAIAADEKMRTDYCAHSKALYAAYDTGDDAKIAAEEDAMVAFMHDLGPEYEAAWMIGGDLDAESEEGKVLEDAYAALEESCLQE